MRVVPVLLTELTESRPGIPENACSIGEATALAMSSALAPGRLAETETVGNATFGNMATGNARQANTPNRINAAKSTVVMTGRRMNGAAKLLIALFIA